MRYFITGTDTDVGKTRVTAAVAAAFVTGGERPTIVKAVQTGLAPGEPGDAAEAAALAGLDPAVPSSRASACRPIRGRPRLPSTRHRSTPRRWRHASRPFRARRSSKARAARRCPRNATETLADALARTSCAAIVVAGLRLGCISHTLLTLAYLGARGIPVRGVVLVDRWRASAAEGLRARRTCRRTARDDPRVHRTRSRRGTQRRPCGRAARPRTHAR